MVYLNYKTVVTIVKRWIQGCPKSRYMPDGLMLNPEVNSGKHPVFNQLIPSFDSAQDEEK